MKTPEELLRELVRIPSVNPAYGGTGEFEVSEFVAEFLSKLGVDFIRQEVFEGRANIVARIEKTGTKTVLLDAHMDTVGVGGWTKGDPFALTEEGNRLVGRGSCDTKASLAVFMLFLAKCVAEPRNLKRSIVFAATIDEEEGQSGAFKLMALKEELGIVAAITGEPTDRRLIHAHKGVGRYGLCFTGRAAHSSAPEKGDSAILAASLGLAKARALIADLQARSHAREIERPTLNVGTIEGGSGLNVVPDRCVFTIDRRIGWGETVCQVRKEICSLLEDIPGSELEVLLEREPAWTDSKDPFIVSLMQSIGDSKVSDVLQTAPYLTNAVAYAEAGLPAAVFGPGSIDQAHRDGEFITVGEMEWCLGKLAQAYLA